jgi:thiol-disulfide isomerase/thioredoxin
MTRRNLLVLFAAAVLAVPAFAATPKVGDMAPEIQVKEWLNAPGAISLAALKKNIVIVEFWATWCPPCRKSIPHLIAMNAKYKSKGVVILGLTDEPRAKVEKFATDMKMDYPVGLGSNSGGAYGVEGIPHAFIVAPGGKIVWSGHPMDGMDKALEAAIAANPVK